MSSHYFRISLIIQIIYDDDDDDNGRKLHTMIIAVKRESRDTERTTKISIIAARGSRIDPKVISSLANPQTIYPIKKNPSLSRCIYSYSAVADIVKHSVAAAAVAERNKERERASVQQQQQRTGR